MDDWTFVVNLVDKFGPFLGTSVVATVMTLLGVKELVQRWQSHEQKRELLALEHIVDINKALLITSKDIQSIKDDLSALKRKLKINGKVDSSGKVMDALEQM